MRKSTQIRNFYKNQIAKDHKIKKIKMLKIKKIIKL